MFLEKIWHQYILKLSNAQSEQETKEYSFVLLYQANKHKMKLITVYDWNMRKSIERTLKCNTKWKTEGETCIETKPLAKQPTADT